jgi:catechol 2,3-dioxygenase-like lactoylglutathione lyase family enzyme
MLQFGDVAIVVSDAKKAQRWYVEKLGFKAGDSEEHWVTVSTGNPPVELHLCEGDELEPGNTGIGFTAPDVKAEEAALRAKGVEFTQAATDKGWGMFAMFKDPDGNEFWLSQE